MNFSKALVISILALLGVFVLLPLFGATEIGIRAIWEESVQSQILYTLRLPRFVFLLVAGAALAMIGASYQTLFKNPLAEPYILGVATAAALGAVLLKIFFHVPYDSILSTAGSLVSGTTSALILIAVSSRWSGVSNRIVLFGMGLNFFCSSVLFILLSYYFQSLGGGSLRWLFGQIPWLGWEKVCWLCGLAGLALIFLLRQSKQIDALSLGDAVARTLGVSPVRTRNFNILLSSILISTLVAYTGAIGFVGLVVPHMIKLFVRTANFFQLSILTLFFGGVFLNLCDMISRSLLPPFEFPIGIITTLVGAPFFLYLLTRREA